MNLFQMTPELAQHAAGFAVGGVFIFIFLLVIAASVFWIWMLIDCLSSSLPSTDKLIWTLVILFLHVIGAVLYFAIARGGSRPLT